jgi:hypothetical protein
VPPKADDCSVYSCTTLRYLVDARREVTVPLGVILCSPEEGRIWFRLPGAGERIAGVPLAAARADLELVRSQIEGWLRLGQLPYAKEPLVPLSVAWWEQVRGLLQWSVRLGPVHALAGGDPEAELEALYARTVQPLPPARDGRRKLAAAVEHALGEELSAQLHRGHTVPGYHGRPVPVLRLAADDRHAVIVEAFDLAAPAAEREVDSLASRLASIREAEQSREIRLVLGSLTPAKEQGGERVLKAWIEHVAGAAVFDLEEDAGAFRAAVVTALAGLKESPAVDGIPAVTATAARPRRALRSGRRKASIADAPAVG